MTKLELERTVMEEILLLGRPFRSNEIFKIMQEKHGYTDQKKVNSLLSCMTQENLLRYGNIVDGKFAFTPMHPLWEIYREHSIASQA